MLAVKKEQLMHDCWHKRLCYPPVAMCSLSLSSVVVPFDHCHVRVVMGTVNSAV